MINRNSSILISGSMRFKIEMMDFSIKLKNLGYTNIIEPSDKEYLQNNPLTNKANNHKIFENLIDKADLLVIYDKDGYIGLSTAMEIQKALDCKVPVILLFDPEAIEFQALCSHPDYNVKVENKWF